MRFRVDDPAPAVLDALADHPLRIDPGYVGELKRLFSNRGYRRMYCRRGGATLDDLGEILVDRGIVTERPTPDDVLCYLDDLFRAQPKRRRGRQPAARTVEAAERKARSMRLRLFECDACRQKARGTRSSSLICGVCYEMDGEVRPMRRVDPLPEEILGQSRALDGAR